MIKNQHLAPLSLQWTKKKRRKNCLCVNSVAIRLIKIHVFFVNSLTSSCDKVKPYKQLHDNYKR